MDKREQEVKKKEKRRRERRERDRQREKSHHNFKTEMHPGLQKHSEQHRQTNQPTQNARDLTKSIILRMTHNT